MPKELMIQAAQFVPLLAVSSAGKVSLDLSGIVKSLIVVGIGGAIMSWGYVQTIGPELSAIRRDNQRFEATVNERLDDIAEDIQEIRKDFYVPKVGR